MGVRFHSRLPLCSSPSCRQSHPIPAKLWLAAEPRTPRPLCKALRLELSPPRPDLGAAPSWARPAAQPHSPRPHGWALAADTAVPTGAVGPRNTPQAREEAQALTSEGRSLSAPPSAWSVNPGPGVDPLGSFLSSPFSLSFSALSGLGSCSEETQLFLYPDLFARRQPRRANVLGEEPVRPREAVSSSE